MMSYEAAAEAKRALRKESAAARNRLSPLQREQLSARVCEHAWHWLLRKEALSLMAYVSFRSELDTSPLLNAAWSQPLRVLLPRVISASSELGVQQVTSWSELAPGAYGIPEPRITGNRVPSPEQQAALPLPAVVFVPGLAFDSRGGRLGYGRGYYDRLWTSVQRRVQAGETAPVWIGLAYGMQLVPEVPMAAHDAFMDMLITEDGILHCRKGE